MQLTGNMGAWSNMRVEVLISAMNLADISIAKETNCSTDVLIINQTDKDDYYESSSDKLIRMISTKERGLSNSRNMAIKNAQGDFCLICDDDEELVDDYETIIVEAFNNIPDADIIAFDMQKKTLNNSHPRYTKIINYGASKKARIAPRYKTYASVQLAFRRKKIQEHGILFDPRFGAGSGIISAGDETVWQNEAKKRGLKIYYVPKLICYVKQEQSQWFHGLNEKYYYDLGACLVTNYHWRSYFLMYYYVLFIKGSNLTVFQQIKWLIAGIRGFGKFQYSYDEYVKSGLHDKK